VKSARFSCIKLKKRRVVYENGGFRSNESSLVDTNLKSKSVNSSPGFDERRLEIAWANAKLFSVGVGARFKESGIGVLAFGGCL